MCRKRKATQLSEGSPTFFLAFRYKNRVPNCRTPLRRKLKLPALGTLKSHPSGLFIYIVPPSCHIPIASVMGELPGYRDHTQMLPLRILGARVMLQLVIRKIQNSTFHLYIFQYVQISRDLYFGISITLT